MILQALCRYYDILSDNNPDLPRPRVQQRADIIRSGNF